MHTKEELFSLKTFDAAIEQFDLALEKVLENLHDPNAGRQAREITLKVKFLMDDTGMVSYDSAVSTKTASPKSVQGKLVVGMENGKWSGRELELQRQLPLPAQVHTMRKKGE